MTELLEFVDSIRILVHEGVCTRSFNLMKTSNSVFI